MYSSAGINQDSRDKEEVTYTLADVAGNIVVDFNNKIHLLRKEILELGDFGIQFPRLLPDEDLAEQYQKILSIFLKVQGHLKIIDNQMKHKDKNGWKHYKNNYDDGTGISSDTINTCSSENCLSDEISYTLQQPDKERRRCRWNKSTHTESKKSNEFSRTKCYGRRVRNRTSRGVQTMPKINLSHQVKRKVVSLLKFKWCSKKACEKRNQECSEIGTREIPAEFGKSIKVINKPRENSGRNDNFLYTKSNNATSDTNDNKTKETPAQTNGNNNTLNKNYNRKYDFSVDGTNIEIIRTEKSGTGEKNSKLPIKFSNPSSRADPEDKRRNIRKKRLARSKRNAEKATAVDEKNYLLVTEEGGPSQIDERKGNKSKTRKTAAVKRKDNVVDKTVRISEPKGLKSTNNRASNSTEKDAPPTVGKIDEPVVSVIEKPATEEGTAERAKESKNPPTFKSFTKRVQKSFASRRPSNEESHDVPRSEPISKQLDAKRNAIADVKNRLDACIADLNDIIFNLSKLFEEIPAPGSGPAGEGAPPENINRSRQGRSRVR